MREIVLTAKAPEAIGPYSQAIVYKELVYTSGQLPLIPETMQFPKGGIREQAQQALINLKAVLEASGASIDHVIKVTCFMANMDDFLAFNEIYETFFQRTKPARSCVEVARLPRDALIELEAIAIRGV